MVISNEIEHEKYLIAKGQKSLAEELHKAEKLNYYSSTEPGRYLIHTYISLLSKTLDEKTAEAEARPHNSSAHKCNLWMLCDQIRQIINLLSLNSLALLTIKAIEDSYGMDRDRPTMADLSHTLGVTVKEEVRVAWYTEQDSYIGERLRKSASMPGSTPKYRRKRTKQTAKRLASERKCKEFDEWNHMFTCRVGEYLLEIAYFAGIIQTRNIRERKKEKKIVELTEAFHLMLLTYEKHAFETAYETHPLIDVPLDWEHTDQPGRYNRTGGYHLEHLRRGQPMCRGKGIHDSVFGAKSAALQNRLQHTAWRIDSRVLEVALELSKGHESIGKFLVNPYERPAKGIEDPLITENPERLKEWRSINAAIHRAYGEENRKCVRTRKSLLMAQEYKHKTFYLSWWVDWRGRFYSQQSWLAPVGATDFEKSLLKFRDGCKVSQESMLWIYSAIGSAHEGTKTSTNDRVRWTVDNKALIEKVGSEPLNTIEIWKKADDPWTFLQLCLEWYDVITTRKEKFWRVPLQVDSTASGLQILSGMRRDPVGMKNTNLLAPQTPDAPPEDAYMEVLRKAEAIAIKKDQQHLIKYLKFRSVGKPVVMTAIYGAKEFRFKQSIEEALLKAVDANDLREEDLPTQAVLWELATLIHSATKQVFPAAFQALDWLRKLARTAQEQGSQSLIWKTPTNDTIHLVKYNHHTEEVHTTYNGKIIIGDWNSKDVNKPKEVSSFIPAFVHSYDAALLKEAFTDWQHPLSVIHDCVLVLPNDMDRAMQRIREGFVSIVDGDPLARLADDLGVDADSLDRLKQGDQPLDSVYESKYMFN